MSFPEFFAQVPPLLLHDPLAEVLGAASDGRLEYHYADAVRLAGHSCPTVAGAWLMARRGLAALYPHALPMRGGLRVELRAPRESGTSGVTGNILGLLTGAADEGGFQGLRGQHSRRGLLRFAVALPAELRLSRTDTGAALLLDYHPEVVPQAPEMAPLLARITDGSADAGARARFAELWQERVRRILIDHADDPALLDVRPGG